MSTPSILRKGMWKDCSRKSGPQSISIISCSVSTSEEQRNLLSRASAERHTSHVHPVWGTPVDVPLPRTVIFIERNLLQNIHFRNEVQLEEFFYRFGNLIGHIKDFQSRGTSQVHDDQRLVFTHLHVAHGLALPSCRFDEPCCGHFHARYIYRVVRNFGIGPDEFLELVA